MLTVVLAEAELEMVPSELVHHPAVIGHARQRGKQPARILLDSNYHHTAMNTLFEGRRRGRPDMAHLFLLTALESIANKQGLLKVLVHTRNNEMITVHPETRIMRNYERFLGLMEQLFETHAVPDKKHPLLDLQPSMTLQHIIDDSHADIVIAFSKTGTPVVLQEYFKKHLKKNIVCIIGGFPSGSFHADIGTIATDIVSIYSEMLPVWTVTSEILVNYENVSR
jgi:rRNA small subunit pseudouridine methyltransferase Nep1